MSEAANTMISLLTFGFCRYTIRFRKICIISFDFLRTVWQRHSSSIGYVWTFMELQLASLSAFTLTEAQWVAFKQKLYSNSSSEALIQSNSIKLIIDLATIYMANKVWPMLFKSIMESKCYLSEEKRIVRVELDFRIAQPFALKDTKWTSMSTEQNTKWCSIVFFFQNKFETKWTNWTNATMPSRKIGVHKNLIYLRKDICPLDLQIGIQATHSFYVLITHSAHSDVCQSPLVHCKCLVHSGDPQLK